MEAPDRRRYWSAGVTFAPPQHGTNLQIHPRSALRNPAPRESSRPTKALAADSFRKMEPSKYSWQKSEFHGVFRNKETP